MKKPDAITEMLREPQTSVTEIPQKRIHFHHGVRETDLIFCVSSKFPAQVAVPLRGVFAIAECLPVSGAESEVWIPCAQFIENIFYLFRLGCALRRTRLHQCWTRFREEHTGETSKDPIVQGRESFSPSRIIVPFDLLEFLPESCGKRPSSNLIKPPEQLRTAKGKHIVLLVKWDFAIHVRCPLFLIIEIGARFYVHTGLLGAFERRVAPTLLVEECGRLVETLLEIPFAVLQRFHAPLK